MRKLILLSLMLTGCSQGNDLTTEQMIADQVINNQNFQNQVKNAAERVINNRIVNAREERKIQAENCRKTARCLGKATYLVAEEWGDYKCYLVSNDKEVSCND